MTVRLYGKGFGYSVRGLFLKDRKVFYRTEAEEKEKQQIDLYGKDVSDWLERWDAGRIVWTISMGGLGPGYEQCIQIVMAEIIRFMLSKKYDPEAWKDTDTFKRDRKEIEKMSYENKVIVDLGITGAQWGAALNLALNFYKMGPRRVMNDEWIKDRHIQVCKNFP